MHSILQQPAFLAGFATCFLLLAVALLLFLIFAPLTAAEAGQTPGRHQAKPAKHPPISRATAARKANAASRAWPAARSAESPCWDYQNNCPRGPR